MRIRTLSLWRQIIFLPRHGARYMYWQQSGPFCLRKPGLEMYLFLWIIWFLYWWGFSQHGLKNGILHGWQEARENNNSLASYDSQLPLSIYLLYAQALTILRYASPCLNLQLFQQFQQFFLTESSTSHFFSANNLISKSHLLFLQFYNILFYRSLGN